MIYLDYDTDEETDKLLGVEHRIHAKNQAIRDAVCNNLDYQNINQLFLNRPFQNQPLNPKLKKVDFLLD